MTRYFAQNTPRAGLEHMMMSVPGFQKRGGGMMILSRFCYKPEDVDCRYCLHYRRRSCQVRTCPYIAERLKSGAIEYLDLILEYFGHIPHAGLHKRIQAVEHWSGPDQAVLHTVSVHLRSRFADRVWDDAPPGYLAALYLLASKERLWQPALPALSHDSIDFSRIVSKPHGSSTPEQTAQALERLTKAAEAGQDCAQYALGKIYRDGQGVEKDIQKAVALFTLAATKENSFAAFALGKLYLAGDAALPRDPAAALKWLTYAAELGNQFAQYRLGKLLLKGDDGIPKDVITAIRWLTAAAKQENGYAEYALALVYLTGEDAPKDSVKALSLLKRSAGRGNQFAQYRLGKLLLQGEDAPKDVKAAIRWLTAAAEQGNQYAQYALGKLYLLGKEVPKDRSSAIKWFQLAADQGNEYAQYFLKHMDDRLGQPPVAAVISLFHHLANIFQEQNQPPPSGGVRVAVDRKLLRKIKAKKIAQGHKADDHEPEMQL